jgi:peptidoglycan/xylan/chitin deacetylase (PgdA/CDA1 family)
MRREVRRVSIAARLARASGGLLSTRPARIACPGGIVSFTFDDFPRSAWLNGGAVLERNGVRGTYYAAMGFAGTANHLGPMFEIDDLRAAHANGHEIACHTFSHRDCCRAAPAEIAAEIDRNAAALAPVVGPSGSPNFAYPFGGVSLTAKRALAGRFDSCRGTARGINRGTIDLADLRSTSLYGRTYDQAALRQLVDQTRIVGGWTIFYTHDVGAAPSDFGCTPEQLDEIAAYASKTTTVLTVRDALARLGLTAAPAPQPRAA